MNANEKCVIKNYKDAVAVFENTEWSEIQSALFYYRWFGEEFLFDMFKEGRENNHKEFIRLVREIKGKKNQ